MQSSEQISTYRSSVSQLLMELRGLLFLESGRVSFPTDSSIAFMLQLSPTALSAISRQCASMSGITLRKLLFEIAKRSAPGDFEEVLSKFLFPYGV